MGLEYTTNDCSGESEIRTIGSMTPCSASLNPKETGKFVTITLESEGSGGSDGADGSDKNTLVSGTSKVKLLKESFAEAGCTAESLKSQILMTVGTCTLQPNGYGRTYYKGTTCDDTNMLTAFYSDSACTMLITNITDDTGSGHVYNLPVENQPLACTKRESKWHKLTCNSNAGKVASYSSWTDDTCSGTPVSSGSVVYDFCQRRTTWSSMVTISDGSMKGLEYTTNDCSGESEIRTIGSMTPCSASQETGEFVTITLESEGSGGSDGADGSDKNTLVSGTSKVEMSCGLLAFLLVKMVV